MTKRFNIKEWQDSRITIKEDGGSYRVRIDVEDLSSGTIVSIKDNQGFYTTEEFSTLKDAQTYILDYIKDKWDLE